MRACQHVIFGLLIVGAAGGTLVRAGQQPPSPQGGVGQTPSSLPLTGSVRERGSSVTPAFEGWYFDKDGSVRLLVGYFNRNTKQEFDIPVGPNNRIEPGGPDMGQPTHFGTGRGWGVFSIAVPKDFGDKKLTWTIVANGFTNAITLHTKADYVVEPFEDAANKNTPPRLKFKESGELVTGAPKGIAEKYAATVGAPLAITVWATDEGPKINVPENTGRGRGRGRGAAGADTAAGGRGGARGDAAAGAGRGAGAQPGARGGAAIPPEFQPPPPLALTWSKFRGPGDVKFDNAKPAIDRANGGKSTVNATFGAPGDYILRIEGNDSTGAGGGGFQCCWTNAHVSVTVKPAAGTGGDR
jgi:hypothetical protein